MSAVVNLDVPTKLRLVPGRDLAVVRGVAPKVIIHIYIDISDRRQHAVADCKATMDAEMEQALKATRSSDGFTDPDQLGAWWKIGQAGTGIADHQCAAVCDRGQAALSLRDLLRAARAPSSGCRRIYAGSIYLIVEQMQGVR